MENEMPLMADLVEHNDNEIREGGYLDGYEAGFEAGGNAMRRYINSETEEFGPPLPHLFRDRRRFPGMFI